MRAESARAALQRLHAGEVWADDDKLYFAHGGKLYFGLRDGKGVMTSAAEQTEESLFDRLVSRYSRRGRPSIASAPQVHAQAAPLVDESGFLPLLKAGEIALGGSRWQLYCTDGRFARYGTSETQVLTEAQVAEILREKRYAWVERRVRSR